MIMSKNMSMSNVHCSPCALAPHSLSPLYLLFSDLCANESRLSTVGRALPSHSLYTHPWNSYTCLTVRASIRNRSSGRNSRGLLLTRWPHRDANRAGRWQSMAHHRFLFNASAFALSKVSGYSRQTCAMYSSKPGHGSSSRARWREAAALAELGAGCSMLEAAAGSR